MTVSLLLDATTSLRTTTISATQQTHMEHPLPGKALVTRRFARSTPTYDAAAIVQREMAQQLVRLIQRVAASHRFENVLELGCGTGLLTNLLVQQFAIRQLVLNDIVPDLTHVAQRYTSGRPKLQVKLFPGDMELIPLPAHQDLVACNAVLQWAARPDTMLGTMTDCVKRGGLLAIATFGPHNLQETRDLTGASLHYLSLAAIQRKLAAFVELIECHEEIRTISFESAYAVLQHLKRTGVNSLQQQSWSPRAVKEFCRVYESQFRAANSVPLTYHPIIVVARRRDS